MKSRMKHGEVERGVYTKLALLLLITGLPCPPTVAGALVPVSAITIDAFWSACYCKEGKMSKTQHTHHYSSPFLSPSLYLCSSSLHPILQCVPAHRVIHLLGFRAKISATWAPAKVSDFNISSATSSKFLRVSPAVRDCPELSTCMMSIVTLGEGERVKKYAVWVGL